MELEFDKEMDSLLRKTGEAERGVLVGDKPHEKPKVHLDADGLSAFAENAMPEKSRALYMAHLADCGHCRRILSGLIMLNADAGPAEERVVAPVISTAATEPWYRRLLLPNLAYVMGGLVLMFGGLIAFTVLQSTNNEVSMSQPANIAAPAARGPMFEDAQAATDQMGNSNTSASVANSSVVAQAANSSTNAANTAANTMVTRESDLRKKEAAPEDAAKMTLDGTDAAKPTAGVPAEVAAPPPAPIMAAPKGDTANEVTAERTESKNKDEDQKARSAKKASAEGEKADLSISARQVQNLPRTQAGGVAKSTPGPSRDNSQNFPNRADNTFQLNEEKRISGKSFQRRNNVWYDISYRSGATTNVRRGTEEYRNLDSGLRAIAESLNGVVVVMWNGKAYRIQ